MEYNLKIAHNCQVKDLDKIYLKYFPTDYKGFFIEVGAFNGYDHSNVWGLAEDGWKGICYEPIPEFYSQCVLTHKNNDVKVINTAIGSKMGFVDINVCGPISTVSNTQYNSEFWKQNYRNTKSIRVPITTLDQTLYENKVMQQFDILSLDVEGLESDVLRSFSLSYWLPKLAIVEVQEFHESVELRYQAPFINEYFGSAGYSKIYCDDINTIYLRGN